MKRKIKLEGQKIEHLEDLLKIYEEIKNLTKQMLEKHKEKIETP